MINNTKGLRGDMWLVSPAPCLEKEADLYLFLRVDMSLIRDIEALHGQAVRVAANLGGGVDITLRKPVVGFVTEGLPAEELGMERCDEPTWLNGIPDHIQQDEVRLDIPGIRVWDSGSVRFVSYLRDWPGQIQSDNLAELLATYEEVSS